MFACYNPLVSSNTNLKQAAILEAALQLLNQLIEFCETWYEIMPLEATQTPYSLIFLTISNKNMGFTRKS